MIDELSHLNPELKALYYDLESLDVDGKLDVVKALELCREHKIKPKKAVKVVEDYIAERETRKKAASILGLDK